eukprot:116459-Pyramimonas_sp.AAC.1
MPPYVRMRYIVPLQPVHGSAARLRRLVASLPHRYCVFFSGTGRAGTGGVAALAPFFDEPDVVNFAEARGPQSTPREPQSRTTCPSSPSS